MLDDSVIAECQKRRHYIEWLEFGRQIDCETPKSKTQILTADNYGTHNHPKVQAWLAKHLRFTTLFTPSSVSWLNVVKRFFRAITDNRPRRGLFTSVPELTSAIDEYVANHITNPKSFR